MSNPRYLTSYKAGIKITHQLGDFLDRAPHPVTAEEIHLNGALEKTGARVVETDLGEWIIQLRHEGPSHMVMPAIHLSRYQVSDLFTEVTRVKQGDDIQRLVKVARKELRAEYVQADMGISGANFAVAEAGMIGTVTNEGNLRLVTTLPRVHVVIAGLEKLIPTVAEALRVINASPDWKPGSVLGKTVKAEISMYVEFRLEKK